MINVEVVSAAVRALAAGGKKAHSGAARTTFIPGGQTGALSKGVLKPLRNAGDYTLSQDIARRNGPDYEAVPFVNEAGTEVTISTGSLFNPVRVIEGMKPADLKDGQLYAGEKTVDTYRYGQKVADCARDTIYVEGEPYAAYEMPDINLTVEKVYVTPRFVDGSSQPIYDSQCRLRKAWFAE